MRRLFRLFAMLLLLVGIALLVRDGYASWQAQTLRFMDVGTLWAGLDRDSLQLLEPAISRYLHPFLWHPVMVTILLAPASLLFAGLGLVIWAMTRLRTRPASQDLFMRH